MKKMTSKNVKKIAATAMAMTLAVPTTFCMKTTAVEAAVLDDALVTYDFEDGTDALTREGETNLKLVDGKPVIENGDYARETSTALPEVKEADGSNVLEFKDSKKVDSYEKTESDELDEKYPVGTKLQMRDRVGGRVKVDNPFKGMTFEGEDAGVSISYWVKVPVTKDDVVKNDDGEFIDRGANSTTVVFNNSGRVVKQKDDYAKYLACVAYDTAKEKNDTEALKDYDMGKQEIMKDAEGNAYVVYRNYGKLLRFNPEYPSQTASAEAVKAAEGNGVAKEGGWYIPSEIGADEAKDGKIKVTSTLDGKTYMISSLANAGNTSPDKSQYELFRYSYAPETDLAKGVSSKSKIREESIKGSLQISTDNDFGFREDNYTTEDYTDENGAPKKKAVAGSAITNPNSEDFGKIQDFEGSNQFYFDGDERVTDIEEGAEEWHYVTIVIQNDWVVTYVDGEAADPESDYYFNKDATGVNASQKDFNDMNAGKMFNKGKGLRAPFNKQATNVADWPKNGTASASPANSLGISMLDWIADSNTEMYFGGTSYCAEMLTQNYGTKEGVQMDDISFWGTALTEDEAVELYEEVAGKFASGMKGDVDGDGEITLKDAQLVLKAALKLATLNADQKSVADVNGDEEITLKDAQKVLRVSLKLDPGF